MRALAPIKYHLGSYRTVFVRAQSAVAVPSETAHLERLVAGRLRELCSYESVTPFVVTQTAGWSGDLVIDLSIVAMDRVSPSDRAGLFPETKPARVRVLAQVHDPNTREEIAAADISGSSSHGTRFSGTTLEAVEEVVDQLGQLMGRGGCGDRVAVNPAGGKVASPKPAEQSNKVKAEQINDSGKKLFRAGRYAEARAEFLRAIALYQSPRFYFNLCLTHQVTEHWTDAEAACRKVLELSPSPELRQKVDKALEDLTQPRGKPS